MTLITEAAIVAMRLHRWTGVPEVTHGCLLSKSQKTAVLSVVLLINVCLTSNALNQTVQQRWCPW